MADDASAKPPWDDDETVQKTTVTDLNALEAKILIEGLPDVDSVREQYRLEELGKGRKTVMEFALERIQEFGPQMGEVKDITSAPAPTPKKPAPAGISATITLTSGRTYTIPFKSAVELKGTLKRINAAAHNPRLTPDVVFEGKQILLYRIESVEITGAVINLNRPG